MNDNIYKTPESDLRDLSKLKAEERNDEIRVLASGFIMTLYGLYILMLAILLITLTDNFLGPTGVIVGGMLLIFGVVIIGIGEKNSILLGLAYLFFCLIPFLNLLSIVVILKRAIKVLRKNSYRVKLWGVRSG